MMKEAIVFILLILAAKTNAVEIQASAGLIDDDQIEITVTYNGKDMVLLANPNHCQTTHEMIYASDLIHDSVTPNIKAREPFWKHLIVLVAPREEPLSYGYFKWIVSLNDRPYASKRPSEPPDKVRLNLWVATEKDFRVKTIAAFNSVSVEAVIQNDQERNNSKEHSLDREPGDSNGSPSGTGESPDNSRSAPRQPREGQPPAEPGSAPE